MPQAFYCIEQGVTAELKLAGGVDQAAGGTFAIGLNCAEPGSDSVLGDRSVGSQVDESFFFGVEFLEAARELDVHRADIALLDTEACFKRSPNFVDESIRKLERSVVACHRFLNQINRQMRKVTEALLTTAAQEVLIGAAPALDRRVDQSGGALMLGAAVAEQDALEVVVVDAVTLPLTRSLGADVLDMLEKLVADDRFVAPLEGLTPIDKLTDVVRIFEDAMPPFAGHDTFPVFAASGRGQAEVSHGHLEPILGVLASGIELKALSDQRCTHGINGHGVDLPAFMFSHDVEVADLGGTKGAPGFGLLIHLRLDVQSLDGVDPSVHDVEHAFHRYGIGAFAEVFFGGHEPYTDLLQLAPDDGSIEVVAKSAGAHVDHDEIDVAVFHYVIDQLTKNRAILNILC